MVAIHVPEPALTLRAGARALARIRESGLQPADIHVIPGAAGGPKALGIQGLDMAIFGQWLPQAPNPRGLVGASIGSCGSATVGRRDRWPALRRLVDLNPPSPS